MLSIVIVNYNNRVELERCLRSIYETGRGIEVEVLVFDNNSTDGSAEMVRSGFPSVTFVESDKNIGLTRAANVLLRKASGEYVLLLDSDTEVMPGAIRGLVDFVSTRPGVGVAGPRILNEDGSVQETARRFPNFLSGLFGRRAVLTRLFPGNPVSARFMCKDNLEATGPFEVDYVSAAAMMFRREVLSRVGLMDEEYFVYWSDVDWCRRIKDSGFKVFCVPAARVVHYERYQPRRRKNPRMIVDFHKGAYLYYRKHNARGALSVKNFFAAGALSLRTALHLCLNHFKN